MRVVGVATLKATLSAHLAYVKSGEEVLVTERGKPIARITTISPLPSSERLESLAKQGIIKLPSIASSPNLPREKDAEGHLLKALLDEREEGY